MRYKYFLIRSGNLLLILALLAGYQIALYVKNQEATMKILKQQVTTFEKERKEVMDELGILEDGKNVSGTDEQKISYQDGTYRGTAEGFGGTITVEVVVKDGAINCIEIKQADGEDSVYLTKAKEMIDMILKQQHTDVDTVSGATYSSTGIKNAVKAALEGAVK